MKYLLLFLLGAAVCFFMMKGCMTPSVTTVRDTTYVKSWDTVFQPMLNPYKVVSEPVYIYRDRAGKRDTDYLVRPADVDTAAILSNFFAQVLYNDTLRVKYGLVIIKDTISQNRIYGRSVMERFEIPTVAATKTVTEGPKRMLFVGPDIGFGIGASAAYKTKTDHLWGLGYMLTQHGGMLDLSYKWKIAIK